MSLTIEYRRQIAGVVLALGLAGFAALPVAPVLAKDFQIQATLDCGGESGHPCPEADSINVRTEAMSGHDEVVTVDVSWIRDQLRRTGTKQDDLLCLLVEDLPGGGYRALAVSDRCDNIVFDEENDDDDKGRERGGSPD